MKISTRIIAALQLTPRIGIGCLPRVKIKAVRGAAAIGIMITIAEAGADGNRDQDRGRLIEDALILIIIAIALDDTEKNSGGADRDRDLAAAAACPRRDAPRLHLERLLLVADGALERLGEAPPKRGGREVPRRRVAVGAAPRLPVGFAPTDDSK